jgi:hypothetical protein
MLTFVKTMTVRRKVTFNVPRDGEGYDQQTAFVTFEILRDDDKSRTYDKAFLKRVVKNIEEVKNKESGEPIPFTPEFLDDFVSTEYLAAGLVKEYLNLTVAAGRGN